jgi:hypothetical protein
MITQNFLQFKDIPVGRRLGAMDTAVNEIGGQMNQILIDSFNKEEF